jgi:hypothetical protein
VVVKVRVGVHDFDEEPCVGCGCWSGVMGEIEFWKGDRLFDLGV